MIFLKVKNSYNKKLVTWLDLNLQVAQGNKIKMGIFTKFKLTEVLSTFCYLANIIF